MSIRNIGALLFFITLLTTGYFSNPNLSNQNARLNSIYSVVERNAELPLFAINDYIKDPNLPKNTIDWSLYKGNYYSNKAPGSVFLGVPVYWLLLKFEKLLKFELKDNPKLDIFNVYLINFFTSILPFAFASVAFFLLLLNFNVSEEHSILITLILVLGTILFPYNTHLWGITTACSFSMIAVYFMHTGNARNTFYSGFFLSLANSFDYLTAIISLSMFFYCIFKYRNQVVYYVLGSIIPLASTLLYHYICFDSPFSLSTTYVNPVFQDTNLFLGVFGLPKLNILYELIFGLRRGLVLSMPILILGLGGLCIGIYRKDNLSFNVTSLLIIIFYLLVNSAFNGWHGGSTVAGRYLIPSIPFWIFGLVQVFKLERKLISITAFLFTLVSFVNMLVMASVSPLAPDNHPNPLYGFLYKYFLSGNLSYLKAPIKLQAFDPSWNSYKHFATFNWGELFGLSGFLSIVPLLVFLAIISILLFSKITKYLSRKQIVFLIFIYILYILFPGILPWINDEPFLALKAIYSNEAYEFAKIGLVGTKGIPYGPIVTWFYQLIFLITSDIYVAVILKTTFSFVLIFWGLFLLTKKLKYNSWLAFIPLLSPYVYHYSRLMWDNCFLLPISIWFFVFLTDSLKEINKKNFAFLTFTCFLLIQVHLISLALIIPALTYLKLVKRKWLLKNFSFCLILSLVFILGCAPYILQILNTKLIGTYIAKKPDFINFILGSKYLSFFEFFEYFVPEYFSISYARYFLSIEFFSLLIIVLFFLGLVLVIKKILSKKEIQPIVVLSMVLYFFSIFFAFFAKLDKHPHYLGVFVPVYIILIWYFLDSMKIRILELVLILYFVCSFIVFSLYTNALSFNHGTQGLRYGTILKEQNRISKKLLAYKDKFLLETSVKNYELFPHSLQALVKLNTEMVRKDKSAKKIIIAYDNKNKKFIGKLKLIEQY